MYSMYSPKSKTATGFKTTDNQERNNLPQDNNEGLLQSKGWICTLITRRLCYQQTVSYVLSLYLRDVCVLQRWSIFATRFDLWRPVAKVVIVLCSDCKSNFLNQFESLSFSLCSLQGKTKMCSTTPPRPRSLFPSQAKPPQASPAEAAHSWGSGWAVTGLSTCGSTLEVIDGYKSAVWLKGLLDYCFLHQILNKT